ncbi:hypothetical protein WH390_14910 (plasmid) [Candidatus Arsenophonus nilaparvatae]|uniref:hypothetical protein n=1 Tax=Candidatus Arsenophonus nilaparvatae TaxID=1247023 RepID=UPI003877AA9D
MNTLAQRTIIKHSLLNRVKTKSNNILSVRQKVSVVKRTALQCLQLVLNVSLYFPITFIWLTVAFALSGHFSMSYPFEPDAMYLTFDKVIDLLTPVFRLSVAITLIICLLRQTAVIYQEKFNRKEST